MRNIEEHITGKNINVDEMPEKTIILKKIKDIKFREY